MTDTEATSEETTSTEAAETEPTQEPVDVGEEMAAYAAKLAKGEDPDEPAEKAAKTEAKDEDDTEEDEEKADEGDTEEDGEKEAEESEEEPKKKRVSTHQRQKARIEHLRSELSQTTVKLEEQSRQLEQAKQEVETRAQALAAENKQLREFLNQAGYEETPESRRATDLERELMQLRAEREHAQKVAVQRREQAKKAYVAQQANQMATTVREVAETNGVDPQVLGVRWVNASNTAKHLGQPEPTVEDIAQELALLAQRKQQAAAGLQAQHSSQAPSVVAGRSTGIPRFDPDVDGMVAFLKSEGLVPS